MSGGEQQMLAIGRALMADPKLLLLDEPSMGIAPILVERIYETIAEINRQGTTILLVEQNANFALGRVQARLRARDRHDRARRRVRRAARQPRGPEGIPGRMTVIAAMGATALYLLYAWLASAIVASYLSDRKGYGEKPGLAAGLILSVVGVLVWLVWPARARFALEAAGRVRQRRQDGRRGARGARRWARGGTGREQRPLLPAASWSALAYAGLSIAAGRVRESRGRRAGRALRDLAFGAALGAAAYTVILLISRRVRYALSRFTDALTIIAR